MYPSREYYDDQADNSRIARELFAVGKKEEAYNVVKNDLRYGHSKKQWMELSELELARIKRWDSGEFDFCHN